MSFIIIQQDSVGIKIIIFNYALYFFPLVLQQIIEVSFFLKKYIQFAVDIPLSICIYLWLSILHNINIISNLLKKMSMDVHSMFDFVHKNESDSECFSADIQSTKYFKAKPWVWIS